MLSMGTRRDGTGEGRRDTDFKVYGRVQVDTSMKIKGKLDWLGGGWGKDPDPSLIASNSHSRCISSFSMTMMKRLRLGNFINKKGFC